MSDARDELVDVIAEAMAQNVVRSPNYGMWSDAEHQAIVARSVLAALVSRYGEPEIEDQSHGPWAVIGHDEGVPVVEPNRRETRLVFPWQAVEEGEE